MLETISILLGACVAALYLLAGITIGLWLDTKIPDSVERLFHNRVTIALLLWLIWPVVIAYVLLTHWIGRLRRGFILSRP